MARIPNRLVTQILGGLLVVCAVGVVPVACFPGDTLAEDLSREAARSSCTGQESAELLAEPPLFAQVPQPPEAASKQGATSPTADVAAQGTPQASDPPAATSSGEDAKPAAEAATTDGSTPEVAPPVPAETKREDGPKTEKAPAETSMLDRVFGKINSYIGGAFMYPVPLGGGKSIPLMVAWLIIGAIFCTLRMKFINFRGFFHAVQVTRGKYDDPDHVGEVSHFQALSAALSATVGLGNIAGVAIAIGTGGPGASFWLIVAGLLGMTAKMVECTLGQMYREMRPDGRVMGGAMFYLSKGLAEIGMAPLGRVLAVLFAILCIGGSFGGGNAFQVKQSLNAIQITFPFLKEQPWIYGLVMMVLTGIVIIGGIRRIATIADKIVPLMCGIYVLACSYILLVHVTHIPAAFVTILNGAFRPDALYGGFLGVLVIGFKRAAFSNEAGVGSAAIAHSAAKTPYAVREGIVALLEPFIDTVVVCTMTALVCVITNGYDRSDAVIAEYIKNDNGAALTSLVMGRTISWFPYVLSATVFLFAYSTQISWSYYGERCWAYLFGDNHSMSYRTIFLVFTFLGSIVSATNVLEFSDLMILGMAFPNLIGVLLLSGKVRKALDEYWAKYQSGELDREVQPKV